MSIKRLFLAGLMLLPLVMSTPARAVNLSNQTLNGLQQNIKPAIPANAAIKKTSPVNAVPLNSSLACPKLFAKGLRVVRVVPQPARGGVQTYRFILDGNIANRGATGLATAGFNVTQSIQGKPGKRIALKLFKKQVNKKQVLGVSRDLRVTIQSDALSRAQASHTVFKMNVTNLRNARGACGEYNPTVSTLSAAQVSRALPAQVRGVSQQVGVIPPAARPPARAGFAAPALPAKRSLKTQNPVPGLKQPPLPMIKTGRPVPKVHPVVPGMPVSAQSKPAVIPMPVGKQKPHAKPVQGFGLAPQATTKKPVEGGNGFAPKVAAGSFGLNKPVTAVGGKPLLPPGTTAGPRHVLHDDHAPQPRIGGFAPGLGVNADIAHAPVTGPGGGSLLPAGAPQMKLTLKSVHRVNDRSDDLPANIVGRGDRVLAVFDISNLGTATGDVKVGKIGRPLFITDEVATVAPGQTVRVQLEVPVTNGNNYMRTWSQVFRLMTTTNQEYRDSYQADNYVTATLSFDNWSGDIAVEKIFGGNVRMNPYTVGYDRIPWLRQAWKGSGSSVPETYTLKVRVGNYDVKASSPRQLTVALKGLTEFNPVRGGRHFPESNAKMINCSTSGCPLSVTVTVPALEAGERRDIPVTFNNLGYRLWVDDKARKGIHRIRASGYYKCVDTVGGTNASIQVTVSLDTQGDAVPANNGLRQSFSVGHWAGSGCQVSRLADAQVFFP